MLDIYEIVLLVFAVALLIFLMFSGDRVKGIKIGGRGIVIEFGPVLKEIENSGIHVVSIEDKRTDLPERDAIIESFSALKEIIFSLARKEKVDIGKYSALEVVDILINKKILSNKRKEPMSELYSFGKEVMDQPNTQVPTDSGKNYRSIVFSLVNDLRGKLLDKPTDSPRPKRTQVGGPEFLPPTTEKPSVVLNGIAGSVQGRQFSITNSIFRIGADSSNDLVIPDDKYVSSNHAHISYDNGDLNLYDDNSTNGTFLNKKRLGAQPLSLRIGDEIKIGNCVFKVE